MFDGTFDANSWLSIGDMICRRELSFNLRIFLKKVQPLLAMMMLSVWEEGESGIPINFVEEM
jgi:hypothetical protein